jgi:transposase
MNDTTLVGIDDSQRTLTMAILRAGATEPEEREIPNEPTALRRLMTRLTHEGPVAACYEAGVSGYDLYRRLTTLGVRCDVIAPALTPRRPGDRIKTNRRDARKLVKLYRAGELTTIHVPDESQEAVRDLVRCRDAMREEVGRWRHRVLRFLLRHGRVFPLGRHWTQAHRRWLYAQVFALPALGQTFQAMLGALNQAEAGVAELERQIATHAAEEPYRTPVGWLRCFRGFDTLSAMILLAEVVDFHRFTRPRELMAYLGMVPREHSTGDRHQRGAITKTGNAHARRILVEAAWHYRHPPGVSVAVRRRQAQQPAAIVAQAWKAQQRLHRRYRHLVRRGKPAQVAVVAIARELAAFLWAALRHPLIEATAERAVASTASEQE